MDYRTTTLATEGLATAFMLQIMRDGFTVTDVKVRETYEHGRSNPKEWQVLWIDHRQGEKAPLRSGVGSPL